MRLRFSTPAPRPRREILGVSTVVGNVSLNAATRNTRAVLALAGRGDIPVWPGAATPLSPGSADARHVHGESGLGHAVLPEPPEPASRIHAVDAIIAAAHAHAGRLIAGRDRAPDQCCAGGDARARAAEPR